MARLMGRRLQIMQCYRLLNLGIASITLMTGCGELAAPPTGSRHATPSVNISPETVVSAETGKILATAPLNEQELWTRLQQATDQTYAVMFRHAIAPGTGDPPGFALGDCSTQRNLSAEGRQQAIHIGNAFRDRNIPITQVRSSQWCRCLETARLLNLGDVQPFPALNSFFGDRSRSIEQTNQVRQFLLENHNKPGVILLMTHQVNITALSDIVPQSGAAIVMQISNNQINILGQLQP
jgi:phosphohistidine phosphatase SixA